MSNTENKPREVEFIFTILKAKFKEIVFENAEFADGQCRIHMKFPKSLCPSDTICFDPKLDHKQVIERLETKIKRFHPEML